MTKLTTERLETIATWREQYGNGANVMIPAEEAELMARQLLAYEQAAKNPFAWSHTKLSKGCGMTTPLYAAPVLPELLSIGELLHRLEEQTGEKWVEESVQHVIPGQLTLRMAEEKALSLGAVLSDDEADAFADGWNTCRAEMLKAQQNEPQNIPKSIPAQPVIPEQPKTELVDLSQQVEILNRILNWILKELPVPTQKASVMAIRLSSVIDIISDFEVSAPAQPVSNPYKLNCWISVADRLPSEFGRYLCYVEEQNDLGKSHYQWNCSWNGDVFSDSSLTGRVTHWMPLPAAPAQESE